MNFNSKKTRVVLFLVGFMSATFAGASEQGSPTKMRPPAMPAPFIFTESSVVPPVVLQIKNEGSHLVKLSNRFINRIATPFKNPRIVHTTDIVNKSEGSSILISPKGTDAIVIYITGDEATDKTISLTILPMDIAAQTVTLQLDIGVSARKQAPESYTQELVDLMRQVASNLAPEGFTEGDIPPVIAVGGQGIQVFPKKRYSSSWLDIYKYTVKNNQPRQIEISETSFYKKGVRSVSIFPTSVLNQNEETTVFVIVDKTVLEGGR